MHRVLTVTWIVLIGLLIGATWWRHWDKIVSVFSTGSDGTPYAESVSQSETSATGVRVVVNFESQPASQPVETSVGRCTLSSMEYLKKAEHFFIRAEQKFSEGFALISSVAVQLY